MMADAGIALPKLLLGLAVFVALGYLGKFYDKRIAGVLLTFPILNGIGILTGDDPLAVADSIYAVVVFNGLLLFLMVSFSHALPPMPANVPPNTKLVARLLIWSAIWLIGATLVTLYRDYLPGVLGMLLIQLAITAVAIGLFWKAPTQAARARQPEARNGHERSLVALWATRDGAIRLSLFTFCCVFLFVIARYCGSNWVGTFSALPLPGLFAVATLSVTERQEDFDLMRDSVLIGPVTVIAFNWLYAQTVFHFPGSTVGFVALMVLLGVNAALIFWIVPRMSAYLDRVRQ
jgi:hypothetical protein